MFRFSKKVKKSKRSRSRNNEIQNKTSNIEGECSRHNNIPAPSQASHVVAPNTFHHEKLTSTPLPATIEEEKIFALIESGSWDKVRKKLNTKNGKKISKMTDGTGLSILGMALGSSAPIDIVELTLNLNPDAALSKDVFGAMPLHLGCLNGISVAVIQMIIDVDGGHSARVPDKDNRTALHHAVEYACLLPNVEDSSVMSLAFEESLETIELLISVAPETVHFTTSRGDAPLDIPQLVKIKRKVNEDSRLDEIYQLLKATSIDTFRQSKEIWERNGYDTKQPKEERSDNRSLPSLLSSHGSSAAAKSALYAELDKMSLYSAGSFEG